VAAVGLGQCLDDGQSDPGASRPATTLQLHGHATIIDWTDAEAREVFSGFLLERIFT
jgi:hypothetical protein